MKPLRILYVSDIFYPYPGGVSEHIDNLARFLRKRGHETFILTANFKSGIEYNDPDYVIRMGRSIKIPINKSLGSITVSIRLNKLVKKFMSNNHFHIVHVHGPIAVGLPSLALLYSRSINVATFHSAHEEMLLYKIFKGYIKMYFEKLHGKIAVSELAKRSISRYFDSNYRIIPNGIDVQRFNLHNQKISFLANDDSKKILFVGRIEPRKGLKYLILALNEVIKFIPNVKLVIVGDSPFKALYKQYISKDIKDKVIFVGRVGYEELPKYYASCDVFVSPATEKESFGIVLLEAMASKIPVIASNIEGYRQVIKDEINGFLFENKNYKDLANKIIMVLKNRTLVNRVVEKAYIEVLEKYSWEVVSKKIENYYYELLSNSSIMSFNDILERNS
ncbi:MAG: glycosyltransferase family 4 protein [candidate division WOR-3 bacterium]|nr:glycosyltransferase family 4 protein [candidate division WOR-3 bacterium]MCX7947462.1 glycosyltransferase family 4 protein [candidate division WOR-3 bacterium]MDW8150621.1 glycosyltransferase family 4 protein [candidate division WOR-3 bacterium]